MKSSSNPIKKKLSKGGYIMDARLKALVSQYVQQNKESLIFVDEVLDWLLSQIPEYSRKNQNSLKHSIMKILETLKVKGFWKDTAPSDDEANNPDVPLVEATDHNFLNNSLISAYKSNQNTSKQSTPSKIPQQEPELNGSAERRKLQDMESTNGATSATEMSDVSLADSAKKKKRRIRSSQSNDKDDLDNIVKSGLINREIQPSPIPTVGYESLGGISNILQEVRELIEWPMLYPPVYNELKVPAAKGILLHGPPGCGKTLLANAIAGELGRKLKEVKGEDLTFFKLSAPELVSGMSGESEANLRNLFKIAMTNEPCLIFIDEIDVICTKRENASKEMERRIVAQLLTSFDDLYSEQNGNKRVLIVGSTNRIESLDPSLRRNGRFDKEIPLGVPDEAARAKIIEVHANKVKIQGNFDYVDLARRTPGFVGADLAAITTEAAAAAVKRIISTFESHPEELVHANTEEMQVDSAPTTPSLPHVHTFLPPIENSSASSSAKPTITVQQDNNNTTMDHIAIERTIANLTKDQLSQLYITMDDFIKAIKKVQPSAKREGFATIPNVSWEDVGALGDIRQELEKNIIQPIKFPWKFRQAGLEFGGGVLLYGPPGCGKTLLAKAIAHDCSASFISVKGPELLNKFVGESERAVRKVFERAKLSAPCIIFFDELDALCPRRDDEGNAVTARVVNQLLTEMDGLEDRKAIYVIAATNRPDMIDPAMLRHQRLGKLLYVPLPDEGSRLDILKTLTRTSAMNNVDLVSVAKRCVRFSGADLAALVKEAKLSALCKDMESTEEDQKPIVITADDFQEAFKKVGASVSADEEKKYLELAKQRETRK